MTPLLAPHKAPIAASLIDDAAVATSSVTSPPVARIWLLDREMPPPSRPTKRQHAARLLRWVHEAGFAGNFVLSLDLKKIYPVMCEELGWKAYPWQTIAAEMRDLTGGKKTYKWIDGERRRVYFIPPAIAKETRLKSRWRPECARSE